MGLKYINRRLSNGMVKSESGASVVFSATGHGQSRLGCDPVGCDEKELPNVKTVSLDDKETRVNCSSTPRGEVSRSDGGESEPKGENATSAAEFGRSFVLMSENILL